MGSSCSSCILEKRVVCMRVSVEKRWRASKDNAGRRRLRPQTSLQGRTQAARSRLQQIQLHLLAMMFGLNLSAAAEYPPARGCSTLLNSWCAANCPWPGTQRDSKPLLARYLPQGDGGRPSPAWGCYARSALQWDAPPHFARLRRGSATSFCANLSRPISDPQGPTWEQVGLNEVIALGIASERCGPAPAARTPLDVAKPPTQGSATPLDQASDMLTEHRLVQLDPGHGVRPRRVTTGGRLGGSQGSQLGQAEWVDRALGGRTGQDLLVVEAGAFDGLTYSNSLFLELERNWSCLLVEGNPVLQERIIRSSRRRCHLFRGALSPTPYFAMLDFQKAGPLGGVVAAYDKASAQRAADGVRYKRDVRKYQGAGDGSTVRVPCYPLHVLVAALGRRTVDYWSLDTEGSEGAILEATDFSKLEVGLITVEHNLQPVRRNISRALSRHGFQRVVIKKQDDYWANPTYFARRKIPMPFPDIVPDNPRLLLQSPRAALVAPKRSSAAAPAAPSPSISSSSNSSLSLRGCAPPPETCSCPVHHRQWFVASWGGSGSSALVNLLRHQQPGSRIWHVHPRQLPPPGSWPAFDQQTEDFREYSPARSNRNASCSPHVSLPLREPSRSLVREPYTIRPPWMLHSTQVVFVHRDPTEALASVVLRYTLGRACANLLRNKCDNALTTSPLIVTKTSQLTTRLHLVEPSCVAGSAVAHSRSAISRAHATSTSSPTRIAEAPRPF